MKVETKIKLNRFIPRDYQLPFCRAFDKEDFRRYLLIWPRRSGKDITAFSLMVRKAIKRVGSYFYILPTFSSGRRILWDAIDNDGKRVIDYYCPSELVESKNEVQMRIRLINGSQIIILGSDNYDNTLIGTNALGMVFSEFALQDERAWKFSIPILKASDGWAVFVSTPRGKNHLWDLYNIAHHQPSWFCEVLNVDQTGHIDIEEIEKDISEGIMSRELSLQEYWCSFSLGVEGSFYSRHINKMRLESRIGKVLWEPYFPVHTAWDLGYNDPTCIIFFQVIGPNIHVIDYYEKNKMSLEHFSKVVLEKEYSYGKHIAPFDIAVHDLGTGISRWKMMHDLGITFIKYHDKAPGVLDGIEAVRRILPRMWIDEDRCEQLIKALDNYRQEYDVKRKTFKLTPLHDWSSHAADAMRYLAVSLSKVKKGSSPDELNKRYQEAMYGVDTTLPPVFRNIMDR